MKKRKISSLLQVLNVHTVFIFHLLMYVDVHCVFTHCGLWLLFAIGKMNLTVYCLHCIYLYDIHYM